MDQRKEIEMVREGKVEGWGERAGRRRMVQQEEPEDVVMTGPSERMV